MTWNVGLDESLITPLSKKELNIKVTKRKMDTVLFSINIGAYLVGNPVCRCASFQQGAGLFAA